MVRGKGEGPVVYGSLTSLTLTIPNVERGAAWGLAGDAALFPVLSKPEVVGKFPFKDDVFFRGNRGALQNLRLPFDALTKGALQQFGGYASSDFGHLCWEKSVCILFSKTTTRGHRVP
ncbi:hypothetical protein GGI21_000869 [Coemansia aciculifera]|nr:hypothetical protein GGI21_000869 [Coemansia aciculifera]